MYPNLSPPDLSYPILSLQSILSQPIPMYHNPPRPDLTFSETYSIPTNHKVCQPISNQLIIFYIPIPATYPIPTFSNISLNISQPNPTYPKHSLHPILSQPIPMYPNLSHSNPNIPTYSYNLSYPNLFQCIQTYLNPTQHISTYPNVSQPSSTYPNPTFYLISSSIFPAGLSTGTTCTDIILS